MPRVLKVRDSDYATIKYMAEEQRMTQKAVAERYGVTPTGLKKALRRIDPEGTVTWNPTPKRNRYERISNKEIFDLIRNGHTQRTAAKALGIDRVTLRKLSRERDLGIDWERVRQMNSLRKPRPATRKKLDYEAWRQKLWPYSGEGWTRVTLAEHLNISEYKLRYILKRIDPDGTFVWYTPAEAAPKIKQEKEEVRLPDYGVRRVNGFPLVS